MFSVGNNTCLLWSLVYSDMGRCLCHTNLESSILVRDIYRSPATFIDHRLDHSNMCKSPTTFINSQLYISLHHHFVLESPLSYVHGLSMQRAWHGKSTYGRDTVLFSTRL